MAPVQPQSCRVCLRLCGGATQTEEILRLSDMGCGFQDHYVLSKDWGEAISDNDYRCQTHCSYLVKQNWGFIPMVVIDCLKHAVRFG